jgi:AcrR family transcriptional regulator
MTAASTSGTGRRAYSSALRQEQASRTRARVLATATRLFGERGWGATSMRDVAREAGVSVETVYAAFGAKSDLLMAALDVAVVGDDRPVPLAERPDFAALGAGRRDERLAAMARLVTGIHERTAGVNLALREGARSDEALDRAMRRRESDRWRNVKEGLSLVLGHEAPETLVDTCWAVIDIGVYRALTDLRGWSAERYEGWLAGAVDAVIHGSTDA